MSYLCHVKISGFTFVRNAVKYGYPVVEAITSILSICDEFVVCLGNSDDGTEELIRNIPSEKIRIVDSVWDDSLRTGGRVLAVETDKAFDAISADSDWAFYIQADEVVHEKFLPVIKHEMEKYIDDKKVDCLVFKYLHFYGNYKYVGNARNWYRREIRVIKNDKSIRSYRDAQGFRRNEKQLSGKLIDAWVYHYGWARSPRFQTAKLSNFEKLYKPDDKITIKSDELYDYGNVSSLALFDGTHPEVMKSRIADMDWDFEFDITKKRLPLHDRILDFAEQITGKRFFEFRNYKLV